MQISNIIRNVNFHPPSGTKPYMVLTLILTPTALCTECWSLCIVLSFPSRFMNF